MSVQTEIMWGETIITEESPAIRVEYKLGELADITSSKRIFYSDYVPSGVPFFRSKEIIDRYSRRNSGAELFISEERFLEIKNKFGVPEKDDILLTSVGTLGIPYLVTEKDRFYFKDGNLTWFRKVKKDIIDARFLLIWLTSAIGKQRLDEIAIGSTQAALTIAGLKSVVIELPELAEQRAIADIISGIDDKIALLYRQNSTLEALAEVLFKQWFIAFEYPNAYSQPYRSNGGIFVESDLGEIPVGWRLGELNDIIAELETGTRPKGGVSAYSFGVPSIGAESIVGIGRFDYSKTKYVPEEYFATMKRGHIKSRDVLIYKDGGTPGNFKPHVSMFGDDFPFAKCCVNDHVYRLRVKNDAQNFAYLWLTSDLALEEMTQKGTGAAIPGLNSTALKSLTTLIPDSTTLRAFEDLTTPLFTRILSNSKQMRTLSTLRDTLLPKLMGGEVRVAY